MAGLHALRRLGGQDRPRPPAPLTWPLFRGHADEDKLRAWFTLKTGVETVTTGTWVHREHDWMRVNPDGLTSDSGGLACKSHSWRMGEEWTDDQVSDAAELQAQWGMAVTGLPHWWVISQIGQDEPLIRKVKRDPDLINVFVDAAGRFWHEYVLTDTPPPVTGLDVDALRDRWRVTDAKPAQGNPAEYEPLIRALEDAKADEKAAAERRAGIEARLRALAAEHEVIELAGQMCLSLVRNGTFSPAKSRPTTPTSPPSTRPGSRCSTSPDSRPSTPTCTANTGPACSAPTPRRRSDDGQQPHVPREGRGDHHPGLAATAAAAAAAADHRWPLSVPAPRDGARSAESRCGGGSAHGCREPLGHGKVFGKGERREEDVVPVFGHRNRLRADHAGASVAGVVARDAEFVVALADRGVELRGDHDVDVSGSGRVPREGSKDVEDELRCTRAVLCRLEADVLWFDELDDQIRYGGLVCHVRSFVSERV
ncbi:YqaJ viral recombinase family protein [Cellulosimicrobium composti]|uniref:YqaJ viral recombinase family protein n=1 Tax=Cellulosimicrobium composti TaxID=2672572 RepID=UPI00378B0634